ncbi:DUF3486 family protein (plasmid) [Azospirillum argentinense]|uniref:DUF3486 family protein n=1 Tax=Azospirillum argentinense TaxID=2970906 RepID=A0A4D8PVP9_9PROT|nr:phage protein Gp27 family protein [Azospirillum argentinense]QCN99475.1 DUF3486 family protein [Azospirillum argentinense]
MARLSAADRWPPEIREQVGKLRAQGATIDAIRAKLLELDIDVPRSTLGREIKELDDVIRDIRQSREMAEAIGTRIDDRPASSTARANVELLQALTMRLLIASRGEAGQIEMDAKEAKAFSEVIRNLANASKVDLDQELKIREEMKAKAVARWKRRWKEATQSPSTRRPCFGASVKKSTASSHEQRTGRPALPVPEAVVSRPQPLQDRHVRPADRQDVHHHARHR